MTVRAKTKTDSASPPNRSNPQSLAQVLRAIRENFSGRVLTLEAFAGKLARLKYDYGREALSPKTISAFENNRSPLYFWHIELYAKHLRVPTAFVIFLSRVNYEFREVRARLNKRRIGEPTVDEFESEAANVLTITKRFRALCDHIDRNAEAILAETSYDANNERDGGISPKMLFEFYQIFVAGRVLHVNQLHLLPTVNDQERTAEFEPAHDGQLELFANSALRSDAKQAQ
ncbi:hypothetical protein I6F09_34500 [Bradyrhizobium sp. IC3195]|uniref:hypothetical protein n=1 Tax=Bradyrhizobium sp. IC3195 TaxID=2793804 RepID=UPI001CD4067C|nr:hypothetical protein [Bradyrhizobium sp. IC3195]MCA1472962.1 hypothetical protein [Bradyrhizobium sp. IC3195]